MAVVKEQFTLPRGCGVKMVSEIISGLLTHVRVVELHVGADGVIDLTRQVVPTDPPGAPYSPVPYNPYEALGHLQAQDLPSMSTLEEAELACLRECDARGMVPLGFLLNPKCHPGETFRARHLGVPVAVDERCNPAIATLFMGLETGEGMPSATSALLCGFRGAP